MKSIVELKKDLYELGEGFNADRYFLEKKRQSKYAILYI